MLCRWVGGWGARIDSSREPERAASSYLCDLMHLFYFCFCFFNHHILDAFISKVFCDSPNPPATVVPPL